MTAPWCSALARTLSSPLLFDEGVEAARNACVAGASIASAAITATAWYDNPLTGLPALRRAMERLTDLPLTMPHWHDALAPTRHPDTGDANFSAGFGYVTARQARFITARCQRLVRAAGGPTVCPRCAFFARHHTQICAISGPLNQAGLAALAFVDAGLTIDEGERQFLVWRIDTAIGQAQRTRSAGLTAIPFFSEEYVYEGTRPASHPLDSAQLDSAQLLRAVGLE